MRRACARRTRSAASAACSPSPRERVARAWSGSSVPTRPARRRRSRASSRSACATSPTLSRTSAESSSRPSSSSATASRARRPLDLADVRGQERGTARARDRRGRSSQPAARRARPAPGRRCSRAGCRGSCRRSRKSEALEVTRIHSVAGLVDPEHPLIGHAAVPRTAPQRLDGGDRRRRAALAAGRGEPRAPRRAAPRRARGVPASALEALRQPLEDGELASRARRAASASRRASS